MELTKQRIHTNVGKCNKQVQFTLDGDYNLSEHSPDIEKMIHSSGMLEIREVEAMVGRAGVKGALRFQLLYLTPLGGHPISSLEGTVEFDECVYDDCILPSDTVKMKSKLEDLNVSVINSRKLSIRAIYTLEAIVCEEDTIEGAMEISERDDVQAKYETIQMTTMEVNKKDIYRKKQEFILPAGKPDVHEVLWWTVQMSNVAVRVEEEELSLTGELNYFILYSTEEEHVPVQFFEINQQLMEKIPCEEVTEDMIADIMISPASKQLHIKQNDEGENRILEAEITFDLDIRAYEDRQYKLLKDVYSPNEELKVTREAFSWSKLMVNNSAKTKVLSRVKIPEEKGKCEQILNISGDVKIDELAYFENGVKVEGVVDTKIFYLSSDDRYPVSVLNEMIPFSYLVEGEGMDEKSGVELNALVEQIGAVMLDDSTLEVKGNIALHVISFARNKGGMIVQIEEQPLDSEKMQKLPSMVGYIVKKGETLWDIAKAYYTTIDNLMEINGLEKEEIKPGDRLIICK